MFVDVLVVYQLSSEQLTLVIYSDLNPAKWSPQKVVDL